jgi:hypothetical protein
VYLTVGNIPKAIRRKPSQNAVLFLALLPKFPNGHSAASTQEAIHKALTTIFEPLKVYSASGLNIDCADGFVRQCYPQLTAWIGDTPEQSLMTNVIGGFCPVCVVPKESLKDQSTKWPLR